MMMTGRRYSADGSYRYGFNGKEKDNDVKGEGNQQDYGMRIYDPRLGRFLSGDPLTKDYPYYSPYQFAGNMPIWAIDLDGKEVFVVTGSLNGFFMFTGAEVGIGGAIGRDGIALVRYGTVKLGFGIEAGVSLNGTVYPNMKELKELSGLTLGFGIAGAYGGKIGAEISKCSGYWGETVSWGWGAGAHASFDISYSKINVITWADIKDFLNSNTEESKSLKILFGLNESNKDNAIQIIQDFYNNMAEGLKNKRIQDLKEKNKKNEETIKQADVLVTAIKQSNWITRLFMKAVKRGLEEAKEAAENDNKKNKEELKILENTDLKIK